MCRTVLSADLSWMSYSSSRKQIISNGTKNSKSRPGTSKKNKIGSGNRERKGMLVETVKAETGRMEGVGLRSLQMGI